MKYPIYPITFSYVSGIFCGFYFSLPFLTVVLFALLFTLLYLTLYMVQRKNPFNTKWNFLTLGCVCLVFICLGILGYKINNKPIVIDDLNQTEFTVKVTEVLKSNQFSHRAYAELLSDTNKPSVLISFSNKDSLPIAGGVYKLFGSIKEVPEPRNPYDFNYKKYLQNKHIQHQITSYHAAVKVGEEKSFFDSIINFREYLLNQFSKLGYSHTTKGFIEALLFGKKNNLDQELQQHFKDFGILHVLAVSGMHVVILFVTLSYILKRLRVPPKIVTLILVAFLLVFTVMAGFSGSVVRASLMCFMTIIGILTNRSIVSLHLLVGSMLLILLIAPNYLFDVGFQLSYLAVLSIVYYYPVIQKYFTFKNGVINYFSQLIGISLIAQLGVLPLSIYYFKQIPLLFLIGNIIAIPFTTFLLAAWFVQMILSLLSVKLLSYLTPIFEFVSNFCFTILGNLSDYFSIKAIDFYLDARQTILLLLMLFTVFWYFKNKQFYKISLGLVLLIGFQIISLKNNISQQNLYETLLLSDTKNIVILDRMGKQATQRTNTKLASISLKNYMLHNDLSVIKKDTLTNAFMLHNKKWLLVDSLGIYPKIKTDYVVLHHNAKINLERLVSYTQPEMVILHNSNPEYLVKLYADYFDKTKIPYYDMRSKGAYVIHYNSNLGSNSSGVK